MAASQTVVSPDTHSSESQMTGNDVSDVHVTRASNSTETSVAVPDEHSGDGNRNEESGAEEDVMGEDDDEEEEDEEENSDDDNEDEESDDEYDYDDDDESQWADGLELEAGFDHEGAFYAGDNWYDIQASGVGAREREREEAEARQYQPLKEEVYKIRFSAERCLSQEQSPLFNALPPEIRDLVFHYALMDYEDLSKPYKRDTPYGRPGYRAPRRTDTALLRTCQRIYQETWYRPWAAAQQTLWFASSYRRPDNVTTLEQLAKQCRSIERAGVDAEIDHVRIFAQLYAIEDGTRLRSVLKVEHFKPRLITICIRHTDWWNWESDENMYIGSTFVTNNTFPESVREIRFELESLERRKGQVDSIAEQMKKYWVFQRSDGRRLTAVDSPLETEMRRGTSTWEDRRWLRDEIAPGELSYYMRTLSWKPSDRKMPYAFDELNCPAIKAINPPKPFQPSVGSIHTEEMKMAGISPDTSSEEAVKKFLEWDENGRPDLSEESQPIH